MLRYVVAAAILLIPISATLPVPASALGDCPSASAGATFLCVSVSFSIAGSDKHEWVTIDWGDGTSQGLDCPRINGECGGTVPHTYVEPGTYIIEVTALSGACPSSSQALVVDVREAELIMEVVSQGPLWVQPGTSELLDATQLRRSTVDWGDGTPVEEFDWTECGEDLLCLPRHDYAANGDYTVVTRLEYLGAWEGTCYERIAEFEVEIGTSTAAEETTWGVVKSRYR